MNDDDLLVLVRDRMTRARDDLGSVRMEQPVSAVLHRGRSRRLRHRLYGAAAGAGALAVGLGVVGIVGPAAGITGGSPSASATATGTVHVNLDAWSVNTGANGSVTLLIRQLRDKAGLEQALAAAGIPAVVIFGGSCLYEDFGNASEKIGKLLGHPKPGVTDVTSERGGLTLYPAGIPSGDDMVIEIRYGADGKLSGPTFGFRLALLPQGTALSCPDSAKLGTVR
jgi:hypothetical protein